MSEDVADAVLDKVKHFSIGFGRAGDTPAAKGTGALIKHGELHGILTCAHVDKLLRELKQPVGLVRLNRGLAQQSPKLSGRSGRFSSKDSNVAVKASQSRHERRRSVARLRAQTRRRELRGCTSPANRYRVTRRQRLAAPDHVSGHGAG